MSDTPRIVRIFISSPGDVVEERNQARRVIEGLQKRYPGITLQPVLWEELALPATASFQETIDLILHQRPIDIAVFILWSRLGSPLSSRVSRPDGTPYRSGTEREFDLMLTAFEQSSASGLRGAGFQPARPIMLAYTRDDTAGFQQRLTQTPINELEELLAQQKLATSFIREQFHDADGRNMRAYQTYREPVDFVARLRTHLQQVLADLLGTDAAPRWHEEPYRGLEVFDVRHSDIFCGRDEETCDLLQRLRDQRRAGCAFAVIVGASGSGKSSLARAGVAATLLQHASDDGVKEWRTAFVLPALMNQASGAASAPRLSGELTGKPNLEFSGNLTGGLTPPRSPRVIDALARTLIDAVPELRTSPTAVDDIAGGLTSDPALTIRLSIAPAFARAAESANGEVRLLLVIDQMEELWTDRRITSEDRDQFFAVLEALSRSGHVTVLATLRSDFYPHAQQVEAFLRLKGERGHFDLLPPSAAALHRLIVEPARLAGLTFERHEQTNRSLDEIILQDATRDPTVLPLLQYALSELYRLCSRSRETSDRTLTSPATSDSRRLLTFAAYEALGGVEGALGQRAEEIFQNLPESARAALPELLPLLVTIDVAGEQSAVRRRTTLPERTDPPTAQQQLIDSLIAARFLTTDRQGDIPVASLAHEALLRRWERISTWITSNREHLRLRARVEQSQHRWASQQKHASLLLPTGLPLEEGQVLLREARPLLLAETTDYIERSVTHRQSESRRQRLIRTTALTMSLTAALIAILAALWINSERNAANIDRQNAVNAQRRAETAQKEEARQRAFAVAAQKNAEAAKFQIEDSQRRLAKQIELLGLEEGLRRLVQSKQTLWQIANKRTEPLYKRLTAPDTDSSMQTFASFLQTQRSQFHTTESRIDLQPVGPMKQAEVVEDVAEFLSRFYGIPAKVLPAIDSLALPDAAKRERNGSQQWLAQAVINAVQNADPPQIPFLLVLTENDLWSGDLNYVFGVNDVKHHSAIISLNRFRSSNASADADVILLRRALKVAVFVTGQDAGIRDFAGYECCMNRTNSVAALDSRPLSFCPECERKVWWLADSDPLLRYEALKEFAASHKLREEQSHWEKAIMSIRTGSETRKTE